MCSCVADHLLASAPNNGSIVLWNLQSKALKNKQGKDLHICCVELTNLCTDYVFKDVHQRAVNKICWHPRDVHLLISGSQDCTMQTIVSIPS